MFQISKKARANKRIINFFLDVFNTGIDTYFSTARFHSIAFPGRSRFLLTADDKCIFQQAFQQPEPRC
jgi:hypothetical protein